MPKVFDPVFRRRTKKSRQAAPIGDALQVALRQLGLSDQAHRLEIYRAWATAVGPEVAARTEPMSYSRGVLVVKAASAAWQNELTFLKSKIITKINEALGKARIKELRVVGGKVARAEAIADPWTTPSPSGDDKTRAQAAAAVIADPEVRAAFEAAMACARSHRRKAREVARAESLSGEGATRRRPRL